MIGPLVALVAWVWVIKWRYAVSWRDVSVSGFAAWVAALPIMLVPNSVFGVGIDAFGIPGG